MSTPPNRRLHEDVNGSGSCSGNHSHPSSVLKFPHDDHSSAVGGKVVGPSSRHDYHAPPPYDVGVEGRMPKIAQQRNETDRRSPLPPNMLFRVSTPTPTPNDSSHADHVGTENRMEFRDSIKVDNNREAKSESRELQQQTAKSDKYADENKDSKHAYSEPRGNEKMNKDGVYNSGSNNQLNWKDMKEQHHRVKQYPDVPAAAKESLHVDNNNRDIGEAVGENKIDMKGDDKFKDKDRKRKEVKQHWDWGERDKDRRNNNFPPPDNSENKEVVKEERESERWGNEKKEQKEKLNEKEKDHVKRELWSSTDKEEVSHNEKEVVGKSAVEQESSALEPKKKDHDTWKNVDRKKERDTDYVEPERPDKRSRYHEKESDEGGILAEGGGADREREVFNSGVQQRKRMLRSRSSPQMGNNPRHRAGANDNEGYVFLQVKA
ncbi:hypothetical protein PHJA_001877600 [Phtheirospermum japonicum]|uniref:Uncharacterized protein n=1 Tax=Phtheirospermum japonicum TaxID=374723 RepID=A0A830CQN7_9LAMI|nr:hypothetical protein PHJA_001877600 [Phtheirospermum japonicum]